MSCASSVSAERLRPLRRTYEDGRSRAYRACLHSLGDAGTRSAPARAGARGRVSPAGARRTVEPRSGNCIDVDGLDDVAGKSGVDQPVLAGIEWQGRHRHDRDARRPRLGPEHPSGLRAVQIRKAQVHQDDVRQMLGRERDPLRGCRGLERPKPGRAEHVAERASGSCRCRRRSGRAGDPTSRAYSPPMPIRLVLAEDHYLVREGVRQPARGAARIRGRGGLRRPRLAARGRRSREPGRGGHRHPDATGPLGRGDPGRQATYGRRTRAWAWSS